MGTQTLAAIVSEGSLQAGDTGKTNRATADLMTWLRSQYAAFLWPFLKGTIANVSLAAGQTSVTLGAGSGGITPHLQRINDPVWIYPSDYSSKAPVRIITDHGDNDSLMADPLLANVPTGMPTICRVRHSTTPGQRYLDFDLKADKAYKLKISYYFIPDDPASPDIPVYPNDRTMIQAVKAFVLGYNKADNASEERDVAASMVTADMMKYGMETGIGDAILLDPKVFR